MLVVKRKLPKVTPNQDIVVFPRINSTSRSYKNKYLLELNRALNVTEVVLAVIETWYLHLSASAQLLHVCSTLKKFRVGKEHCSIQASVKTVIV